MICLDTNVIIYLGNGVLPADIGKHEPMHYASISAIELLGYPDIRAAEELRLKELLSVLLEIPLSQPIIETAVQLRQLNKMSVGDAIIAATALTQGCELWTANTDDFRHIEKLKLFNPLTGVQL